MDSGRFAKSDEPGLTYEVWAVWPDDLMQNDHPITWPSPHTAHSSAQAVAR